MFFVMVFMRVCNMALIMVISREVVLYLFFTYEQTKFLFLGTDLP